MFLNDALSHQISIGTLSTEPNGQLKRTLDAHANDKFYQKIAND